MALFSSNLLSYWRVCFFHNSWKVSLKVWRGANLWSSGPTSRTHFLERGVLLVRKLGMTWQVRLSGTRNNGTQTGDIWVWVNTYRYIFSGMNIHLPAILGFTRGTRFWHTLIFDRYLYIPSGKLSQKTMENPPILNGKTHEINDKWSFSIAILT